MSDGFRRRAADTPTSAIAALDKLRELNTVEFGIGVGEYEGVVRISRRVFQILVPETRTPERCLEAYHLHRTRLELIAERKVRRKQLTEDGNVEITGRDLREREVQPHYARPIGYRRVAS
jgi:hypothetical protein